MLTANVFISTPISLNLFPVVDPRSSITIPNDIEGEYLFYLLPLHVFDILFDACTQPTLACKSTLYNGIQQNNIEHIISNNANAKGYLLKSRFCDRV